MRIFETLEDAVEEIRRDVYKGVPTHSTRVQQWTGLQLDGHERLGYEYGILDGFPKSVESLVQFGSQHGFKSYLEYPETMMDWLRQEEFLRLKPEAGIRHTTPSEVVHPALRKTLEGHWPSYTYTERLYGALDALETVLAKDRDSRRAFWPIFRPEDSLRASAPTRIPCSLGYQAIIRKVGDEEKLLLVYLERSGDFDTFWLSDIWLARQFQLELASRLEVDAGMLIHYIISFHSFDASMEIY